MIIILLILYALTLIFSSFTKKKMKSEILKMYNSVLGWVNDSIYTSLLYMDY